MARRIGLLTLPLHANYGGILQAAALAQFLIAHGKDVVLLERTQSARRQAIISVLRRLPFLDRLTRWANGPAPLRTVGAVGRLRRRLAPFAKAALRERQSATHRQFIRAFIPVSSGPLHSAQDMREAMRQFDLDAVVVGSDQVWRLDYAPTGAAEDYFLGFAEGAPVRRVSYAASFGKSTWDYPDCTDRVRALLSEFHAVSVREASGVDICRTALGRMGALHVVDPTLLVDQSFYARAAAQNVGGTSAGKILSYILDGDEARARTVAVVAATLDTGQAVHSLTLDAGMKLVEVGEWLRAFMEARFVVTDSFHGMVFAILFRKDFIAILNRGRGEDRFTSLLEQLGLTERLMSEPDTERARALAAAPVDFDRVHARIDELRRRSAEFLLDALE